MSQSSEGSEQRRPDQASRDGAASAKAATHASAWIAIAVTLSLALGLAYSVISLRRRADDLRAAVLEVARLSQQSSRVDALAWEAIANDDER